MQPDQPVRQELGWTQPFAWLVILACLLIGMWQNDALTLLGLPAEKHQSSEKPQVVPDGGPQMTILLRVGNGISSPGFESASNSSLLGTSDISKSMRDASKAAGPGSELPAAVVTAQWNDIAGALGLVDGLEADIRDGRVTATPEVVRLVSDVHAGLEAWKAPSPTALSAEACARLKDQMGLAGRTLAARATNNTDELASLSAQGIQTIAFMFVAGVLALIVGLGGLVAIIMFLVQAITGKLKGPGPSAGVRSAVYVELFAVWMAAFLILHVVARYFLHAPKGSESPAPTMSDESQLVLTVVFTFVAAGSAISWAFIRGVSWKTFCQDVALTRPRLSDIWWGMVGYSMGVVFLCVGAIVMLVLMQVMKSLGVKGEDMQPSHPVQQWLESGGIGVLVLTYFLASVCAPLLEELLFRGALYRNLRDSFGKAGPAVAIAGAALISSVIFAAIHPQGIVFIPVLGSLAVAFCLMREWRGTINPGMWTHAISNTLMLSLNLLFLR